MPTNYHPRNPRGQQRDKIYREALRLELAEAGDDLKKLREIAKVHIARCEAGDMQAIKELADRLDGKPTQLLEHGSSENGPILRIVREFVHVTETREQIEGETDDTLTIEARPVDGGNGHDRNNR